VIVGGVEQTHFLEYVGSHIEPFVKSDLMMATHYSNVGSLPYFRYDR